MAAQLQLEANSSLVINVITILLPVIGVDILWINKIEQNIAFKAVEGLHQHQWQFSCHTIWCKDTLIFIVYSKICVKRSLSKRQKIGFKTNYRLIQVKSIAECSKGSILQYVRP